MDPDGTKSDNPLEDKDTSALNSTILNYYKKFGKKRDLEQYFSLSTAQSEVRDTSGLFWRRMKSQNDSSDSSDKKTESPTEICRISIKCSIPDEDKDPVAGTSANKAVQDEESQSPPIVIEDIQGNISRQSEAESELNTSQKSIDIGLETSMNKPLSPTGSITYHRKLEWDSLADIGYDNECHRKNSKSDLSTIEKLALGQQYSSNDNKFTSHPSLGLPTAESTPIDENKDIKSKIESKKNEHGTKIHKRGVVKVNIPSNNVQSVNLNMTKHISVNVDKGGGKVTAKVSKSPEKVSVETEITPKAQYDKEIQTTLIKDMKNVSPNKPTSSSLFNQPIPVVINLNSLKKRFKTRKYRTTRNSRRKRRLINKKKSNSSQKSGEQVSEVESFEYMPGHVYNQNQHERSNEKSRSTAGNKSSLESSCRNTTDSSKTSIKSFTKDLEKGVERLNKIIKQHEDNSKLKKKLVQEIVMKLITNKYKGDDDSEYKSGSLFSSDVGLGTGDYKSSTVTTTSNSDIHKSSSILPRKSILRSDKFDSTAVASTTQSVPNLAIASTSEINTSYKREFSETDGSSKGRNSSSTLTTSEELYRKYLEVRRKEQSYKKYLIEKELFLKKKLVGSEKQLEKSNAQNNNIKEIMKDLTNNNYDRGDGGVMKDSQDTEFLKQTRSHSVFTLSSGHSNKNSYKEDNRRDMRQKLRYEIEKEPAAGTSKNNCDCTCQCHKAKVVVTDSAIQVNERYKNTVSSRQRNSPTSETEHNKITGELLTNNITGELKYVCFCASGCGADHEVPDNFLIYKCSRLNDQATQKDLRCCALEDMQRNTDLRKSRRNADQTKYCAYSVSSSTSKEREIQTIATLNVDIEQNEQLNACVQTELNLHPEVSDPTLSDLNIIKNQQEKLFLCKYQKSEPSEQSCTCKNNASKNVICTKNSDCQTDNLLNYTEQYVVPFSGTDIELKVDMKKYSRENFNNIQINQETNQNIVTDACKNTCKEDCRETNIHKKSSHGILRIRSSSSDNIIDKKLKSCDKSKCYSTTTTPRSHNLSNELQSRKCNVNCNKSDKSQNKRPEPTNDKEVLCSLKILPPQSNTYEQQINIYPLRTARSDKPFTRRNTDPNVNISTKNCECEKGSSNFQAILNEVDKLGKSSTSSCKRSCTDESNTPDKSSSRQRKDGSTKGSSRSGTSGDPIMDMIKDITRRYSKRDPEKNTKKKCLKEIMAVLNYLVDTDDNGDVQPIKTDGSSSGSNSNSRRKMRDNTTNYSPVRLVDRGIQPSVKKETVGESSDFCCSDAPRTTSNSQASKILTKIQRQCECYTQRRSKSTHRDKKIESTTSTSDNYKKCRNVQMNCNCHTQCCLCPHQSHTSCRTVHKSKSSRTKSATTADRGKYKCVAYNLLLQTSDSVPSEYNGPDANRLPLRNVVVKVPSKRNAATSDKPTTKTDTKSTPTTKSYPKVARSRSLPGDSDFSSTEGAIRRAQEFTVRHYLEKNRPDFIRKTVQRQDCLKIISEARSSNYRKLLSLRLAREPDVNKISMKDLTEIASDLSINMKSKIPASKIMSEKEMKKHSEKIYKTLPEVLQKKEELKKERIKKTNLIMANLYRKNLQRRTLRGTVNASNYSPIMRT